MVMYQDKRAIIQGNFISVVERIRTAAIAAGRNPDLIRLVVVTKTQPIELIRMVVEAGAIDLGENYIEEAIPKISEIGESADLHWHMIGHLQRRKVQNFCRYFDFIHSLDSYKLAVKINEVALTENRTVPAWLEFNIGGEESKSGINISDEGTWGAILPEIEYILQLPNLSICGVMTVPPYSEIPEDSRPYFQKLRKFQDYIDQQLHPRNFNQLSIGMSSDFEIAIEEGSTCVRIGQAIFGPRVYRE